MLQNKLLLHACCAPCCAYSSRFLKSEGYEVTVYFYNPNIYPENEYKRRLDELIKFCEIEKIPLIIENPDFNVWNEFVSGYEQEPEKGKRCYLCYLMRLDSTAQKAKELGLDYFTTTLSISPHKSYEYIKEISAKLSEKYEINYLDVNLKKKDGYKKSVELSKEYGFYRQDYCGCKYSIRV